MSEQEKRELLVRLAENVLGGKRTFTHEGTHTSIYTYELPNGIDEIRLGFGTALDGWNPLESHADAWMLVEALRKRECAVVVTGSGVSSQSACYVFSGIWSIGRPTNDVPEIGHRALLGWSVQDTIPLAISRAADAATREAA